jgi:chromosome partitioning protein
LEFDERTTPVSITHTRFGGRGTTEVLVGTGWPQLRRRVSAALGWPGLVSRETTSESPDVSRETVTRSPHVSRETAEEAPPPVTVTSPARPTPTALVGEQPGPRVAADAAPVEEPGDEPTESKQQDRQPLGSLPRPARTRVMVVANQKGGVGKTTTAVNMAAALAQHGLRVLVVDLDPQGNASTALSVEHPRGTASTYDALVEGRPLSEVVVASPAIEGLYVVPATIDLAGAEIELVSMVARENRLRRALHAHPWIYGEGDDRFDYVLIDCPPSLGLLTLNALVAGDEMLIPIQAEYYALEGLGQLLETVEMVKEHLNPQLQVSTIVLTMYDARTRLSAGVADEVRAHFATEVLSTAIPRSVRISEAPSYGQTVMTYDPGSPGALSYLEAARELAASTDRSAVDEGARA